jgi:hypothetical protein
LVRRRAASLPAKGGLEVLRMSMYSVKTVESASADHVAGGKYIEHLKEN